MKRILLISLIIVMRSQSFSCSCIGKANILKAYENSDVIILGRIINRREVSFWKDTTLARRAYEYYTKQKDGNISYIDFINQNTWKRFKLEYTVVIQEKFKGTFIADTLRILTGFGGGDCGYNFKLDQVYLIYASNITEDMTKDLLTPKSIIDSFYTTSICTRTSRYSDTLSDIKLLREKK